MFSSSCCSWVVLGAGIVLGFAPGSLCDPPLLFSCSDLKLRVRILIDGTLIIFRVKPEDAGKYTCIPSNSLGRSPSASAYLTVQCECSRGAGIGNTWLAGSPRGSLVLV